MWETRLPPQPTAIDSVRRPQRARISYFREPIQSRSGNVANLAFVYSANTFKQPRAAGWFSGLRRFARLCGGQWRRRRRFGRRRLICTVAAIQGTQIGSRTRFPGRFGVVAGVDRLMVWRTHDARRRNAFRQRSSRRLLARPTGLLRLTEVRCGGALRGNAAPGATDAPGLPRSRPGAR